MPDNEMGNTTVTEVRTSRFGVHVYLQNSRNGAVTDSIVFYDKDDYEDISAIYEYFESIVGIVYRDGQEISQSFDATFRGEGVFSAAELGLNVHYFEGVLGGNEFQPGPSFAETWFGILPWDANGGASSDFSSLSAGSDFFF
jgi:hypothetical protein